MRQIADLWRRSSEAFRRRWPSMTMVVAGCFLVGGWAGYHAGPYQATVELLPSGRDNSHASGLADSLTRSEYVMQRTVQAAALGLPADGLADRVAVTSTAGLLQIIVEGRDAEQTSRLANTYAEELAAAAALFLEQHQRSSNQIITQRLASVDAELNRVSLELTEFQHQTMGIDFEDGWASPIRKRTELEERIRITRGDLEVCELQIQSLSGEISKATPAMVAAHEELTEALKRWTEVHPKVLELRSRIGQLEAERTSNASAEPGLGVISSPAMAELYNRLSELKGQRAALIQRHEAFLAQQSQLQSQVDGLPINQAQHVRLVSSFQALKQERFALAQRLQENQRSGPPTPMELISRARPDSLDRSGKLKVAMWSALGTALAGFLGGLLITVVAPPGRIRSAHDLVHATGLPLIATLADLANMNEAEQQERAFQLFTLIRGKLTGSNEDALVVGFTSSDHAEGRSTWIRLLGEAGGRLGYRVLKVSAVCHHQDLPATDEPAALAFKNTTQLALAEHVQHDVAELPATTAWDGEYRDQWGRAVGEWQADPRLVVLVELPPASQPEGLLLAEALPNVIWLSDCGASDGSVSRQQVEMLRYARTSLVGCVLNRAGSRRRKRSRRPVAVSALFLGLLTSPALAQESITPPPEPVVASPENTLFVSAPDRLASWQQRLTLGPGDTFDISIFERPETLRQNLSIGPDGRLNYYEAHDVMASGLTVDELRSNLEEVLSQFHRAPRIIINPRTYASKKYYMLGHLNQRGVFFLDRPTSVIESIAKAGGFVTTVQNRNSWIQADLARSFLVRRDANDVFVRVPVDFEALFLHGDLSQNFSVAPDDYLFFPPLDLQEVYVLGEVTLRGLMPYTPGLTAIGAIAGRGGFSERAWKSRVLIVRGSLNHPETFILDAGDAAKGKGLDFPLMSRDIIYVHEKPWATAQELLELAAISFAHAAVVGYAGANIGPFIDKPIIK